MPFSLCALICPSCTNIRWLLILIIETLQVLFCSKDYPKETAVNLLKWMHGGIYDLKVLDGDACSEEGKYSEPKGSALNLSAQVLLFLDS